MSPNGTLFGVRSVLQHEHPISNFKFKRYHTLGEGLIACSMVKVEILCINPSAKPQNDALRAASRSPMFHNNSAIAMLARSCAATVIQSLFRGYCRRKRKIAADGSESIQILPTSAFLRQFKKFDVACHTIQRAWSHSKMRRDVNQKSGDEKEALLVTGETTSSTGCQIGSSLIDTMETSCQTNEWKSPMSSSIGKDASTYCNNPVIETNVKQDMIKDTKVQLHRANLRVSELLDEVGRLKEQIQRLETHKVLREQGKPATSSGCKTSVACILTSISSYYLRSQ